MVSVIRYPLMAKYIDINAENNASEKITRYNAQSTQLKKSLRRVYDFQTVGQDADRLHLLTALEGHSILCRIHHILLEHDLTRKAKFEEFYYLTVSVKKKNNLENVNRFF